MKSKEIRIAITAILAIVIIYFGIIFLKGLKLFSSDNIYYVEMKNVGGLNPSDVVIANGMSIGMVKNITYNPQRQTLAVAVELKEGFGLPQGSHANITKEMLGSPKLNIMLGNDPNQMLNRGDTIQGEAGQDLMSAAGNMLPQLQQLMPRLDSIVTAINTLTNDPALVEALHNMQYISENLKTTTDDVNKFMAHDMPQIVGKANNVMANLESTTNQIKQVDIQSIATTAGNTLTAANQAIEHVNTLTSKLDNPNSSIGKLMNDPSVYDHLDSTMTNASRLLEDLRLNPKRYVHFSLFGKAGK